MRNAKHYVAVTILVAIVTVGLYFLFDTMFQLPKPASAEAVPIDNMFKFHFGMMAFLFALIMVIMLYSAFVFRRKPDDEEDAPHIHGSTVLEIAWTILPTAAVIAAAVWASGVFLDLVKAEDGEMEIYVTARQWGWTFEYPEQEQIVDGQPTIPKSSDLAIPLGQPVLLKMEAEDVIHSFWVPEFRVKQDLVPGQTTELRFTPTLAGSYKLRCAEICGTGHAIMLADVRVVDNNEFATFIEESLINPANFALAEERGAEWIRDKYLGCVACHSTDGSSLPGPTWLGLVGREEQLTDGTTIVVDEEYIRNSILNPNAQIVSGFGPNVMYDDYDERIAALEAQTGAEDVIADIIAYMATLEE